MNTNEDKVSLGKLHDADEDAITHDGEDILICGISTHADHYRLRKAKAAHDAILGKIDGALAKKTLAATEAPHLDTKSIMAKLDDIAKKIDLDVSTILAEQIKDLVLRTVR